MNDAEIIRRAVELAEGFVIRCGMYWISEAYCAYPEEAADDLIFMATLAAQLVQQVDASKDARFESDVDGTALVGNYGVNTAVAYGQDRTMNTLRAIVESEVLEQPKG